jgi:RHS repeat-associated protein
MYFNRMLTVSRVQGYTTESKHIYVGATRIATKQRDVGNAYLGQESRQTYYYHPDHLGSTQLVTDWEGRIYEHLEYAPYGELWVDHATAAVGLNPTVYRFTGKEMDEETGFYYYGARYLDPRTSRWISADPAMGEYIPVAPINDDAKKHNQNLPGMGGVFNHVNLHAYHYAGNNPVKYVDPDGESDFIVALKSLFKIDNPSLIFTLGLNGSGTMPFASESAGAGVYINPENNSAFVTAVTLLLNPLTAHLGLALLAKNIEEAGIYGDIAGGTGGGLAGSLNVQVGIFKSREAAQGPYLEGGGSGSLFGVAFGTDFVMNMNLEITGVTFSIGWGTGTPELHARAGGTGFLPIIRNENE